MDREKLLSFRKFNGDCWEWSGHCANTKYGVAYINNKRALAHRVSWEIHNGPIPEGMLVCHHCDNPPCINPDHLFLGTNRDNIDDMVRKGRSNRGIRHHKAKLTEDDVRAMRKDTRPNRFVAKDYGVSTSTVVHVRGRKTWKHIE